MNNQIYVDFINEQIDFTLQESDFITIPEAYSIFKVWFRTKNENDEIPTRIEFKNILENMFLKLEDKIYGMKFKNNKRFVIC